MARSTASKHAGWESTPPPIFTMTSDAAEPSRGKRDWQPVEGSAGISPLDDARGALSESRRARAEPLTGASRDASPVRSSCSSSKATAAAGAQRDTASPSSDDNG